MFTQKLSWAAHNQEALTIEQFAMVHGHACHTADELEVGQVVLVT